MMPGYAKLRHPVVEERTEKLKALAEDCMYNKVELADSEIGIITSGCSYLYVKEVFGDSVSVLKIGMPNPLPEKMIRDFAAKVKKLYVIEELDDIIETHVKKLGVACKGKELFTLIGEYTPEMIRTAITGEAPLEKLTADAAPVRPPVLCPGCPHRGLFYVLNKLKLAVSGDIGCYTLGATPPLNAMDSTIDMGASVTILHGMNKVRGDLLLSGYGILPKDLEELVKCQVIGVIPESDDFLNFTANKLPTFSRGQKAISILSENLEKGTFKLYDTTKNYRGFLGSIKRALKRIV